MNDESAFVTVTVNDNMEEIEIRSNLSPVDIAQLLVKTIELLADKLETTANTLEGMIIE